MIDEFTNDTKKVCTCSALSIFLIRLFVLTPLSRLFITSIFMKIIIISILSYTLFLNNKQSNYLKSSYSSDNLSQDVSKQLNINLICSYTFTFMLGVLIIFVIKN